VRREGSRRERGLASEPVQHVVAREVVFQIARLGLVQRAEDLPEARPSVVRRRSSEHRELPGSEGHIVLGPLRRAARRDGEPDTEWYALPR
jgi:hypothetical protein